MIEVRIETKPAFRIVGRKTWISGTENEQFGQFWAECRASGLLNRLADLRGPRACPVTGAMVLGLSAVEQDPSNRSFFFYVAVESDVETDLEAYMVPACTWAVFRSRGAMPHALIQAEMYAFTEWLPASGYVHANAPEMEVYPPCEAKEGDVLCEFWLPLAEGFTPKSH